MAAVFLFGTTAAFAAESTLRLRVAWGGGAERQWKGSVAIDRGSITELEPLGIEADEPGTIWIDPQGKVRMHQRSERAYDGFDILVTADLDARLTIELEAAAEKPQDNARPAEAPTTSVDIPLKDLIADSHRTSLDSTNNRLLVMRSPGDRLRVRFDRSSLVFAPKELFAFELQPHLLGVPTGTPLKVRAQLVPVHVASPAKDRLWSKEFDVTATSKDEQIAAEPLVVSLPEAEGVYDLQISAVDARLIERWKKPLAERRVQLVVMADNKAKPESSASAMTKMLEIDPANPRWSDRLTNLPLVPGQRRGPLGSGDASRWDHPTLGAMIRLGGEGRGRKVKTEVQTTAWESYPLPISDPGQAHILEIEYPSDLPQMLGISIVEPNAAGAVMPIGLDSGVYVTEDDAARPAQMLKHRLVFWPRTKSPLLLITNRHPRAAAFYSKISVQGSPVPQLAVLKLGQKPTTVAGLPLAADAERFLPHRTPKPEGLRPSGPLPSVRGRLLAAYMDRPFFVENFSAPESMDLFSRRSLDDWGTFYFGSQRLVEYLNHVGYNGLVMSVMADGSSIFPSTRLQPTPQHDTGVFFATGQDPVRKDGVELLLRVFDREGLTFIPALQFAAPLLEIEALLRENPEDATGVLLVGADGMTWTEKNLSNRGLAPYYNPLHPRVQEAMLGVVKDLVDRYQGHASFGGVAIQLTADGYSQFPGAEWGFDDVTVSRFVDDLQISESDRKQLLAANQDRYRARGELLGGKLADAWLRWRADQLAAFHRRMQEIVPGDFLLLGATLFESSVAQRGMRPALPRRTKIDDVFLSFGLRPQRYGKDSGINLVRPYRIGPAAVDDSGGANLELNLSPDVDQLFASLGSDSAMMYHEPVRTRLESFDEQSPFGKSNTYTWLVSQFSPSGVQNRRRFVQSLAASDTQSLFDGGWLLSLGQERAIADFIATYRQLPATKFATLSEASEPVVVRTLSQAGHTYAYLVNNFPWEVGFTMTVEAAEQVRMERLGPTQKLPPLVRSQGEAATWTLNLQPYDFVAVRFSDPSVKFAQPRVTIDDTVREELSKRVADLSARIAVLASPAPLPVLSNPDFEAPFAQQRVAGWGFAAPQGTSVSVDQKVVRSGTQSLQLTSNGPRLSIRSDALDVPRTGRLGVTVWLKVADAKQQPVVRLGIEALSDEGSYYRFATVGGQGPNAVKIPDNWDRGSAPFSYQVNDVPISGIQDLHLRFDLMNAGEIWIDDIQVYDLAFESNERIELSKLVSLADYKRGAGQYLGCLQLLESHWPRFLVEHVPLPVGPGAIARRPARPHGAAKAKPVVEELKKPGVFDRLKDFVPRFSNE